MAASALRRAALIALPLLGAACATRGGGAETGRDGERITVQVDNRIHPRTSLAIRMVSSSGIRTFLGSVPAGRTRRLPFRETLYPGSFHLLAETAEGAEVRSRPFTLFAGAAVLWNLPMNTLTVGVAATDDTASARP